MTSRREFLGTSTQALTGLAFVGCDLLAGHQALPPKAAGGKRERSCSGISTERASRS